MIGILCRSELSMRWVFVSFLNCLVVHFRSVYIFCQILFHGVMYLFYSCESMTNDLTLHTVRVNV